MKCFDVNKNSIIFSEQKWLAARRSEQIHVIKAFESEVAKSLGLISKPRLVFAKNLKAVGQYNHQKNTLSLNRSIVFEGKQKTKKTIILEGHQVIVDGPTISRPNCNIEALFAICHELQHAAQYKRLAGQIPWNANDDQDGIMANLSDQTRGGMTPYINGMAISKNCYELYWIQPIEYDANQSALREMNMLIQRFDKTCSELDKTIFQQTVQNIKNTVNTAPYLSQAYCSDDIVQDVSYCLQNLFAGRQYPVPPALMQDVQNACEASYRYIQSDQYKQMEALLKREINHELAKQECER